MRPTVTEQLRGLRVILEGVVAPEVSAPYPRDMLGVVVTTLADLERRWSSVFVIMRDECTEIDRLVADARPHVDGALATRIDTALDELVPDWLDHDAVLGRYERRRALLAEVVPAIADRDGTAEVQARVVAHLRAHVARVA